MRLCPMNRLYLKTTLYYKLYITYRTIQRKTAVLCQFSLTLLKLPSHQDTPSVAALTSRILFFCPSLTLPARQQCARAFWMMCLLDLALGSLYSLGPEWKWRREHQDRPVAIATTPVTSKKILVFLIRLFLLMNHVWRLLTVAFVWITS